MMRAKMYIAKVEGQRLEFRCVTSSDKPYGPNGESEDNTFARYTPFGEAKFDITNPELQDKFSVGDTFYVDFNKIAK